MKVFQTGAMGIPAGIFWILALMLIFNEGKSHFQSINSPISPGNPFKMPIMYERLQWYKRRTPSSFAQIHRAIKANKLIRYNQLTKRAPSRAHCTRKCVACLCKNSQVEIYIERKWYLPFWDFLMRGGRGRLTQQESNASLNFSLLPFLPPRSFSNMRALRCAEE